MKTIRLIAVIIALIAGTVFSSASAVAKTSPDTVVASLYKQHKKRSPFFQTRSRALVDQFFEKSLADLIWKDAVNSKGEVGALGADPLYNAQDTDIRRFVIHKPVYRSGKADVLVSFENFRQRRQITFQLVSRGSGWKIANIQYGDDTDLLGMLRPNSPAPGDNTNLKVYLVAVGDNGRSGKKVGCEDSLVPVTRALPTTQAPLKAALEELLSVRSESTPRAPACCPRFRAQCGSTKSRRALRREDPTLRWE